MLNAAHHPLEHIAQSAPVIIASATPPGRALRGIIRLSGAKTAALLGAHVVIVDDNDDVDDAILRLPRRTASRVRLTIATLTVPALATFFATPHSYTGEDAAELQLPGNPLMLERIIDGLLASAAARGIDARRAHPGEFTARAFLNGRMSLTQAEGVAATIAAQSDAELRAAHLLTAGALGSLAQRLADELASALALVEAGIDFTDQEDVVAIAPAELSQRLTKLGTDIEIVLDRAVGAEQLSAIPWVVLGGAPNAGKSSLFNALLGRERAVVSALAGTTRDVLAEPLALATDHGVAEVMLVDLAGLDDSDSSEIHSMMQSSARSALRRAELIVWCVPVDSRGTAARTGGVELNSIPVITKCDLGSSARDPAALRVSAVTGEGLEALKCAIARRLEHRTVSLAADALALRPRHDAALRAALASLQETHALVLDGNRGADGKSQVALANPELVAAAMRAALDDLGALAGTITPDDVLGRVFASFCVGK